MFLLLELPSFSSLAGMLDVANLLFAMLCLKGGCIHKEDIYDAGDCKSSGGGKESRREEICTREQHWR